MGDRILAHSRVGIILHAVAAGPEIAAPGKQRRQMMTSPDFQYHYANLKGVRLHYVSLGKGRPVILIHGWPQTWYEWRRVMPLLADKFFLVAPDLRGLGDSPRPSKGYDKKTVAGDLWSLMRDHLGLERFIVIGHDWGAPTA